MKKGKAKKSQVPVAKKPRWKIVVEAIILISAIATIIQVAITIQQMQSQPAPETPLKSDFIIKNVSNIDLYGNSFNWQSTFSVTLDIESPILVRYQ